LNRYPRLRNVLHNKIKSYENLAVEWVHGATPTAFFYAEDGSEIEQVVLGDRSLEEVFQLFSEHGFTPARPVFVYSSDPIATDSYGGHYYEVFSTPSFFPNANSFAQERLHNGLRGYILTVTSSRENNFISNLLTSNGIEKVWMGGRDADNEGEWIWTSVPESGSVFYKDNSPQENAFVNWRNGEPNNVDDEDCALLYSLDGKWNDGLCMEEKAALVIEYGDDPLVEPELKVEL